MTTTGAGGGSTALRGEPRSPGADAGEPPARPSRLGVAFALLAAALVSACHPAPRRARAQDGAAGENPGGRSEETLKVASRLDCPVSEHELSRVSAAPDGRSCLYRDGEREEVRLSIVDVAGAGPQAALSSEEAGLRALLPKADRSAVNVTSGSGADSDSAKVDLPFLHIDADNDKAHIRIFGADIKADGDHAEVKGAPGGAEVHAGPGGAEVRAGTVGARSTDVTFVLASDAPGPSGYRAVGYLAKGPSSGPLVVGEFKVKGSGQGGHASVSRLVDLNIGADPGS